MKTGIASLTALVLATAAPSFAQESGSTYWGAACLGLYHSTPVGSMEHKGAERCLDDINRHVRWQWEVQAYLAEVPMLLESMQLSYHTLELTPRHAFELGIPSVRALCESYQKKLIRDIVDLEASFGQQELDLEKRFPSLVVDPTYVGAKQKRVDELARLRTQAEIYRCVPPVRTPQPPLRYYRRYTPEKMQA